MDYQHFFDFRFVDRDRERKIIDLFLHSTTPEILWVLGESGVGKSYFLKNTVAKKSLGYAIYINIDEKNAASNCVSDLIGTLQSLSEISFVDFVKENYQQLIDFSRPINKIISLYSGYSINDILDFFFNKSILFISKKQEQVNASVVLGKYVDKIIETTPIVITIDNLSYCDSKSIEIILDFIKSYICNPKIRFIISTATSDIDKKIELKRKIISNIPYKMLEIMPFDSEHYFVDILSSLFDLNNVPDKIITEIFDYCNGLPEKLQILLVNMCYKNGITESACLPQLKIDILQQVLHSNESKFDIGSITFYPKLILLIVVCINTPISPELLYELVNFYLSSTKMFCKLSRDKFSDIISEQEGKIIEIKLNLGISKVYVKHDLLIQGLLEDFRKENLLEITSKIIYEFIINKQWMFKQIGLTDDDIQALLAMHAYIAKLTPWIQLNYEYGEKLLRNSNYSAACDIFLRLEHIKSKLNAHQQIQLAICYYENGLYDKANNSFMEIRKSEIDSLELYTYHFFYGKSLNMCAEKDTAIVHFREAIKLSNPDSEDYIEASNLLHLALIETQYGYEEAQTIFNNITKSVNENNMYKIALARLLKGCGNFYSGEDAIKKYDLALQISTHLNNNLETAYIRHNKGFEFIRENNIDMAIKEFQYALPIIEKIKKHETAYTLNNLGICYMFKRQYNEAISILKKALFISKSYYANLTILVHLMHACRLNGDVDECIKYQTLLLSATREILYKDPIIIRKININLAINSFALKRDIEANYYLQSVFDYCKNTSSEYRANKLKSELNHEYKMPIELLQCTSNYKTNMSFEPWCITFSHE